MFLFGLDPNILQLSPNQWRSHGLESDWDKLSVEGANTVGGSGGMLPREHFEIQSL